MAVDYLFALGLTKDAFDDQDYREWNIRGIGEYEYN
jgi:hypothetical protein